MNKFLKLGKDLQIKQLKEVQDEVDQNEKESEVANEDIVIDNNEFDIICPVIKSLFILRWI